MFVSGCVSYPNVEVRAKCQLVKIDFGTLEKEVFPIVLPIPKRTP